MKKTTKSKKEAPSNTSTVPTYGLYSYGVDLTREYLMAYLNNIMKISNPTDQDLKKFLKETVQENNWDLVIWGDRYIIGHVTNVEPSSFHSGIKTIHIGGYMKLAYISNNIPIKGIHLAPTADKEAYYKLVDKIQNKHSDMHYPEHIFRVTNVSFQKIYSKGFYSQNCPSEWKIADIKY